MVAGYIKHLFFAGEVEDELPWVHRHPAGGMQALVWEACQGWNQQDCQSKVRKKNKMTNTTEQIKKNNQTNNKHARDGTNKTARARREKTQTNKQLQWDDNFESKYSDKIVFPGFHASRCTITVILWWHGEFWIKNNCNSNLSQISQFCLNGNSTLTVNYWGHQLGSPIWIRE